MQGVQHCATLGEMASLDGTGLESHGTRGARASLRALRLAATIAVGLAVVAAAVGCGAVDGGVKGSGTAASEARDVESFANVLVKGAADVSISIGDPQSLVVETDDNLLALLETEVSGDTLEVGFRDRASPKVGPAVAIVVPALEGITVDGSAEIEIDEMRGGNVAFTINGSAAVHASGTVDRVDVDVSGSGDVRLFELQAEEAEVSISGSGDAELHVRRSLSASVTGSGHVVYEGEPEEVATSITGSGTIEPR